MKILVSLREMVMGGVQVNAIDLAEALRDQHGCEIVILGIPGPMVAYAERKGLRCLPAPAAPRMVSLAGMQALRQAVRNERPDVVQTWDVSKCLEAYYSVYLPMGVPLVATDMLNSVSRILPKRLPTTFGVPMVIEEAKVAARSPIAFIPPPVDCVLDAPGSVDGTAFRQSMGIGDEEIAVVTVSRLDPAMKTESLLRTLEVAGELGARFRLRVIITGDGQSRGLLEARAAEINAALGRAMIVFSGAMLDPRPAYAAADVVVGMGGSAMRGMAFGKPTVIVGKDGFALLLSPDSADSIYFHGNYGWGEGSNAALLQALEGLLADAEQRRVLGEFSRAFVLRHFSLAKVSGELAEFCRQAMHRPAFSQIAADALRTSYLFLRERMFLRTFTPPPAFPVAPPSTAFPVERLQ